jgi:hypothetical protein
MITIARITAIILIVLGLLVILSGLAAGALGVLHAGARAVGLQNSAPRLGGIGGLLLVIISLIQGLLVLGAGQGLYLLAGLASRPRT